ncbi:phage major capsid protein [Bradyrhizobium frederickii]|uniref:Phage major capsid protein n=1 Tax=Bradyrhizobium frederickii TaxID=2560054 RepID=A0A4Y9KY19_9BRAD|nr:phage major capsid protein [Bradyrhizobium frederickii]TFV34562.1 phage major capsid protein [Bradyrhizobium frederickii]
MASLQELRAQGAAIVVAMQAMADKPADKWNRDVDGAEWDKLDAQLVEIQANIKRQERVIQAAADNLQRDLVVDAALRVGQDQKSEASLLFAKWVRGGDAVMSAEDWTKIRATMSTTTNSQGGYTVQTEVQKTVLDALKAYGGMRAVATVIQTSQGNPMNYPTSDGTSETGEIIAQNTTATAADPSFGMVALNVYKFSSKIIAVPFELLQDSEVDIEAFVIKRCTTRLGRITNTKFTVGAGDGSSEPNGIVTAASTGVTAGNGTSQVTAVVYDSLIDMQHSVDPAYRETGECKWMMHDSSVKVIRKIKDGQSRPIFVPGWDFAIPTGGKAGKIPDSLLGDPIQVNQDMAVMAASAKSIAYGKLNEYTIRDVMDVTMFRFTDSAYTKLGQVGFLAWLRSGGNLIDVGGAVKLFVNAAS